MKDINCMMVRIYVHNMEVDAMFDFINNRISDAPEYWLNETLVPFSVTGGYLELCLPYSSYTKLRSVKEHKSPLDT